MNSKHGTMRKTKKSLFMVMFDDHKHGYCFHRYFQDFDDLAAYMDDMREEEIELVSCDNIRHTEC